MKKRVIFLKQILLVACSVMVSCQDGTDNSANEVPETLFQGEYDVSEMDTAMANARKTLDHFRDIIATGTGGDYAVKVAIRDGEKVEHFWLVDIDVIEGGFKGVLNNEPGSVSNVALGDVVTAKGDDISDWMYVLGEKIHGNYTLRVLLPEMDPVQAALYETKLARLPE